MRTYWAIKLNAGHTHDFIGVYWFDNSYKHPDFMAMTTALFRTRKIAREHLNSVKGKYAYPNAEVVKVRIQLEVQHARP